MKKIITIPLIVVLVLTIASAYADTELLSSARAQIAFKPLSNDDKFAVIRHAKILFNSIYVNLEHKKNHYKVDPLKELALIENSYQSMDEVKFHSSMLAVFNSVEDLHVNYAFPKPYSCYTVILPLAFKRVSSGKIIITTIDVSKIAEVPDLSKITAGDEVVGYNSMAPMDVLKLRKDHVTASTPDARIFQGVFDLYWRALYNNIAPTEDFVSLDLKKANGEIYSIKAPWFSNSTKKCLNPATPEPVVNSGRKAGDPIEQLLKERKNYFQKIKKNFFTFVKSKFKLKYKNLVTQTKETVDLSQLNATAHPSLSWKTVNYNNESFGYFKLTDFSAPDGVQTAINIMSSTLTEKLSETKAIVIDLRENYGGQITLAEKMAALLSPMPVRPLPFYIRANDLTLALYEEDVDWRGLIFPNIELNNIVGPGVLSPRGELAAVSQVYFGKVVLLTNSECFSSCDLFAATMKDNAKVTIYGTDHSTFGGGANVWSIADIAPVFTKLNIPVELPQKIGMRATGRHAYRLSTKSIIEDSGVATDIYLTESAEDVIFPEASSVVARILSDLSKNTNLKNSSETSFKIENEKFLIKHGNEDLIINALSKNIDQIAIFKDNKFVKRIDATSEDFFHFTLPLADGDFGTHSFEIYGFNKKSGTRLPVLRKAVKAEVLAEIKNVDSVDILDNALLTNSARDKKCGWIRSGNDFVLVGPYCPVMKMDINQSLQLSDRAYELSFDLVLDAEVDFDFFEVLIIVDGVEEKLMEPTSKPTTGHFAYDLGKYAGKKIDLKIRFISDEMSSGKGAVISNLAIK